MCRLNNRIPVASTTNAMANETITAKQNVMAHARLSGDRGALAGGSCNGSRVPPFVVVAASSSPGIGRYLPFDWLRFGFFFDREGASTVRDMAGRSVYTAAVLSARRRVRRRLAAPSTRCAVLHGAHGRRPLAAPARRVVDRRILDETRHDINIRGGQWTAFHRRHLLVHAAKPRRVFNKARGWRRRHAAHDGRPRRSYARRLLWDAHCDWPPRELRVSLVRRLHMECPNPSLAEWWSTAVQLF